MSEERREEYLWDPAAEPDPEVRRLEELLRGYRYAGRPEEEPARERRRAFRLLPALLAAAALALAFVGARVFVLGSRDYYPVEGLAGVDRVRVGESLETADGTARVQVAALGDVEVGPRSRLRVEAIDEGAHHLFLERGRIRATIVAEPQVFQVGTPAGWSIDLGCEYDLVVDDGGAARLTVRTGRVAFQAEGREVFVPRGFWCETVPGEPPSVPLAVDAPPELVAAVRAVEAAAEPDPALLARIADVDATPIRDHSVTLWHLFVHGAAPETREVAYRNLARAYPLPRGHTEAEVRARDEAALEAWRAVVQRDWPGTWVQKVLDRF